jgi:molecular chaperone DnaK (HSP70)
MNTQKVLSNQAVGIDFGSSRFIIAVINKGGVEIITNESNYRMTPSLVLYGD